MAWRETCIMEERLKFMAAWLESEESRSSLCRRHGFILTERLSDVLQVGVFSCRPKLDLTGVLCAKRQADACGALRDGHGATLIPYGSVSVSPSARCRTSDGMRF